MHVAPPICFLAHDSATTTPKTPRQIKAKARRRNRSRANSLSNNSNAATSVVNDDAGGGADATPIDEDEVVVVSRPLDQPSPRAPNVASSSALLSPRASMPSPLSTSPRRATIDSSSDVRCRCSAVVVVYVRCFHLRIAKCAGDRRIEATATTQDDNYLIIAVVVFIDADHHQQQQQSVDDRQRQH
jgi:hypothetical protein